MDAREGVGYRDRVAGGRGGVARTVAALLLSMTGCVSRSLRIETDPPGAQVVLDGRDLGPSPVEESFVHYGTREVLVHAPGRRSERVLVRLRPPWYQRFPLDLVSEALWPWRIHDRRQVQVTLGPMETDPEALRERARAAAEDLARAPGPPGPGGER